MVDEIVRVPFNFRRDGKSIRAPALKTATVDRIDDDNVAVVRSSGRKSGQPRKVCSMIFVKTLL